MELKTSHCRFEGFAIQPGLIQVARGGEPIEQVLGQEEAVEFPKYSHGSVLGSCSEMPNLKDVPFADYQGGLIASISLLNATRRECSLRISEPTFAITRYGYANLYHTACDWYATYQAIQLFGHRDSAINVLLLDGHPQGALDNSWGTVFGNVVRIRDFENHSSVCFDELIMVSPGYRHPFFADSLPEVQSCRESAHVTDFSNAFLDKFGISRPPDFESRKPNICYVFRRDYVAHPRQGPQPKVSRKINNEAELLQSARGLLQQKLGDDFQLTPLYFETMRLKDQINATAHCNLLVGVHGAGLSHALFMAARTVLLEISPPNYSVFNFFALMAQSRGLQYVVQLDGVNGPEENLDIDLAIHEQKLLEALKFLKSSIV
jgi:hypothetical protein